MQLFCVFEGVAQSGAHLDWLMEHLLHCSQNILFVLAVALRSCAFVFIFIFVHLILFIFVFVCYLFVWFCYWLCFWLIMILTYWYNNNYMPV